MNIFFREIIRLKKSLLFWCLGLIVLIGSSMTEFSMYKSNGDAINELMEQLPQSIQTVFGMTGFDLTTTEGAYGVTFLYIVLMITIHAVLVGANIISKEERERTSEFLFVKPISRGRIISSKITAGIFQLLIINFVTFASSVLITDFLNKGESITSEISLLMVGALVLQLVFFFIGTAIAAVSRRPKLSASIATSILLVTFIIQYIVNMNKDLDWLKYFTPFKYFEASQVIGDGRLENIYILISAAIVGTMVFVTYRSFSRRDLDV